MTAAEMRPWITDAAEERRNAARMADDYTVYRRELRAADEWEASMMARFGEDGAA